MKQFSFIAVIFLLCLSYSCTEESYRTSSKELSSYLANFGHPTKVMWTNNGLADMWTIDIPAADEMLTVVLQYDNASFHKIYSEMKNDTLEADVTSADWNDIKKWISKPIKKKFVSDGDTLFKLLPRKYNATHFATGKFSNGFCFFTNDNRVFIQMYSRP